MAQTADNLRDPAILRSKDIDCALGIVERCQWLAVLKDLDAYRAEGRSEQLKGPRMIDEPHALIALHPFLARQAFAARQLDA
jgi:hypothetical protein